jgi:NAD-dependent dihydropyrimidine dehydrogenase PreA subunit
VQVCPTDCLAMGRHVPWLARPLDCVRCGLCVAVCPVDALSLASV